jgi:hypothetical protein
MQPIYDAEYFIAKFSIIPSKYWVVGKFRDKGTGGFCAQGYCLGNHGVDALVATQGLIKRSDIIKLYPEWHSLALLFQTLGKENDVASVNNGISKSYTQKTAKERVLAALNDIKSAKQGVPKETTKTTKYVYVSQSLVELSKENITTEINN